MTKFSQADIAAILNRLTRHDCYSDYCGGDMREESDGQYIDIDDLLSAFGLVKGGFGRKYYEVGIAETRT